MRTCGVLRIIISIASTASLANSFATNSRHSIKKEQHVLSSPTSLSVSSIVNPFAKDNTNKKKNRRDNIKHVESITEYKRDVIEEKERITVVRFYSRYCRSCRASEPLFYKLASDFSEHGVNFVEVPLTPNTSILHEALAVPSLPWTHIYHPDAGLVEEKRVSKKFIGEVRQSLKCYVYGICDLEDAPADCMEVYGECAID